MNEYKQPVQIATVDKNNQITWNFDVLKMVLQKANGKRIMIIVYIGNYQIGKTSLIMTMSGNPNHIIGNGFEAQTSGAMIDGPYTIQYLARRFDIQQYFNSADDQVIFFIDVEGFGCFNRGNEKETQALFSKLCTPLISISSIVICPSELNGDQSSMNQITSILRFNDFAINTMNEKGDLICTKLFLMPLIRNIYSLMNIDYSDPMTFLQL